VQNQIKYEAKFVPKVKKEMTCKIAEFSPSIKPAGSGFFGHDDQEARFLTRG
jgi:hypothetical protein